MKPLDTLGGRKFLVTLLAQIVNAALLAAERLTDASYVTVMIATVGAFIYANVRQKEQPPREGPPA